MSATLQEIVKLLNAQYPAAWAAPGDRTGFQVGRPDSPVTTVLVALEASPAVVREAQGLGAQLLLTHHPLIYQSLAEVREDQPGGELLSALIRAGIASVSCHTNLDVAPGGLNDYLARALELDRPGGSGGDRPRTPVQTDGLCTARLRGPGARSSGRGRVGGHRPLFPLQLCRPGSGHLPAVRGGPAFPG